MEETRLRLVLPLSRVYMQGIWAQSFGVWRPSENMTVNVSDFVAEIEISTLRADGQTRVRMVRLDGEQDSTAHFRSVYVSVTNLSMHIRAKADNIGIVSLPELAASYVVVTHCRLVLSCVGKSCGVTWR